MGLYQQSEIRAVERLSYRVRERSIDSTRPDPPPDWPGTYGEVADRRDAAECGSDRVREKLGAQMVGLLPREAGHDARWSRRGADRRLGGFGDGDPGGPDRWLQSGR